jgi:hypothetical protein
VISHHTMSHNTLHNATIHRKEMLVDLQRLVEALDRRVPQLQRVGEAKIATDAAELRRKAVILMAELTAERSVCTPQSD